MLSFADRHKAQNRVLKRQINAQQALLRLSVHAARYTRKMLLLREAGCMAVNLTDAAVGYLYLRTGADPASKLMGETPHYREAFRFDGKRADQASVTMESAPLEMIEAVSKRREVALLPGNTHLLVPLRRHHKVMAMLDLYRPAKHPFDAIDVQNMTDLALLLDSLLKNQHMIAAHSALTDLAQDLSAELDLSVLMDKIVRAASDIATSQASSILLLQPGEDNLRFAAAHGLSDAERETLRRWVVPIHGSGAGLVVTNRQPLVNNNVMRNSRFYSGVSDNLSLKTRSLIAVPLIAQDEVIGALEVVNQRYDDEFDSDDVTILSLFATQAAIAIQNARLLADKQASLIELNRLEQRKSQFIALVSHELRTPLNLVSGYQVVLRENLKDTFETSSDAFDSLDQLEKATGRLTSLVTNITSMYNLETGRTQLMLEERDLVDIVEKVLSEHRQWIQTKGLVISFAPVTRPLCAICDALEVTRILDNLLSNAIKFTPEGGKITVSMMPVEARVRGAESTVKGPFIQVAITDTGPGIDQLQLESIFQRFAQVDNHLNRLQGGMGLGLPLAKALVEKHGGELWVYTARGRGSTFYFTLPAVGGI